MIEKLKRKYQDNTSTRSTTVSSNENKFTPKDYSLPSYMNGI
jgi:hypothetical protein